MNREIRQDAHAFWMDALRFVEARIDVAKLQDKEHNS